jgi:8-oxo-dGTP pyrophosphatase MutT (NUDIX family)
MSSVCSASPLRVIDFAEQEGSSEGLKVAERATDGHFERWMKSGERTEGEAIPAATVVLVRERGGQLETLMLRKNSKLAFGGMWVFPGGRIADIDRDGAPDIETAARKAAVREAREETDLEVDASTLAWISNWVPPPIAPKRFATWFFVAPAPETVVTIDGGEIHEEAWMGATQALARRDALEIELAPPTWVTLHYLAGFDSIPALMADADAREPFLFETHIGRSKHGMAAVWAGDAAYGSDDLDLPGARNRLWMREDGWELEQHD